MKWVRNALISSPYDEFGEDSRFTESEFEGYSLTQLCQLVCFLVTKISEEPAASIFSSEEGDSSHS